MDRQLLDGHQLPQLLHIPHSQLPIHVRYHHAQQIWWSVPLTVPPPVNFKNSARTEGSHQPYAIISSTSSFGSSCLITYKPDQHLVLAECCESPTRCTEPPKSSSPLIPITAVCKSNCEQTQLLLDSIGGRPNSGHLASLVIIRPFVAVAMAGTFNCWTTWSSVYCSGGCVVSMQCNAQQGISTWNNCMSEWDMLTGEGFQFLVIRSPSE